MGLQADIENDQYEKIAELTAEVKTNNGRVEQLSASVDVTNQLVIKQMEQSAEEHKSSIQELRKMHDSYAKLTKWIIGSLVAIVILLIFALIYGAIGERGFNAVSDKAMPLLNNGRPAEKRVPRQESEDDKVALIPWNDDIRIWLTQGAKAA